MHLPDKGVGQNRLHHVTVWSIMANVNVLWCLKPRKKYMSSIMQHLVSTPCPCFHWSGRTSHSPSLIIEVCMLRQKMWWFKFENWSTSYWVSTTLVYLQIQPTGWTLATSWEVQGAECHPIKQKVTNSLCQLEELKGTKCLFYLYRKTFTGWQCFGSWVPQYHYVLGGVKNVNESRTRILRKQQKRKMCQNLPHHLLFFRAKQKKCNITSWRFVRFL